jgi:drug/metabolite transporter (DMT)-like permease
MTSSGLIRWGGVALMLAGLAFITRSRLPTDSSVGDTFQLVAIALLAVGIVGLHALQKDHCRCATACSASSTICCTASATNRTWCCRVWASD